MANEKDHTDCLFELPVGPDGKLIDASWVSAAVGFEVERARLVNPSADADDEGNDSVGGMVGTVRLIEVEGKESGDDASPAAARNDSSSSKRRYAVKIGRNPEIASDSYGLVREANFYSELAPQLGDDVPQCFYARADRATGRKILVMEDLSSGTVSGDFLGVSHPHTWGRIDKVRTATEEGPGAGRVVRETFAVAARMHATFWGGGRTLRDLEWIRGRGDEVDLKNWESSIERSRSLWEGQRTGVEGINMKPSLVAVMDGAMSRISLDQHKERLQRQLSTLCHGDFHPFNVIWMDGRIVLYDWEMVSIGSPGKELGQYMMNLDVDIRRDLEKDVIQFYYGKVIEFGVNPSDLSFDDLWKDYVEGGAGKWIWLLPVLISFCPRPMAQWFCDQMTAFFEDHGLTEENAPYPRL